MDSLTVLYLVAESTLSQQPTPRLNECQSTRKQSRWIRCVGLQLLAIAAIMFSQIDSVEAVQPGYRSVEVSELQQTLQAIGYYDGPITGYYGALTKAAIRRFQADHGLKVDGIAGPQTLRVLQSTPDMVQSDWDFSIVLRFGSSGARVVQLQQYLQVLGCYDGAITGYYGEITQAAVKRFQAVMGLRPTGIVNADTLATLEAEMYTSSGDESAVFISPSPSRGRMRRYWY